MGGQEKGGRESKSRAIKVKREKGYKGKIYWRGLCSETPSFHASFSNSDVVLVFPHLCPGPCLPVAPNFLPRTVNPFNEVLPSAPVPLVLLLPSLRWATGESLHSYLLDGSAPD